MNFRAAKYSLGLALILAVGAAAGSQPAVPAASFDAANKLYEEGRFQEAAAAYQALLKSGQNSATLSFNLGNAFFKSGQIGRALAAYFQAEQAAPRDPDVRANLQFARNQVQGPTLAANRWQRWLGRMTPNEWTVLAAAAFWICLLLLILGQWRPAWRRPLRAYLVGSGVVTVLLFGCLGAALAAVRPGQTAMVIVADASVRHGPLEESQNAFVLHDGAEVRVLDQKDDWLRVTTDPRRIGWVRREQVLLAPAP